MGDKEWVINHLKSIDLDDDTIQTFIKNGYKTKRRFLKLNEAKLTKYFPDLTPCDRDEVLESIKILVETSPELLALSRTNSTTPTSSRKFERQISRDSSATDEDSSEKESKTTVEENGAIPEDKNLQKALERSDNYKDDPTTEYYDIFISYRRSRVGDARALKQALKEKGMKVFLDIDREEGLGVGQFQDQLEKVLHKVPVVLVLMTKAPSGPDDSTRGGINRSVLSSMEHVSKYARLGWTDWCRIEMAVAIRMKKLVVPIYPGSEGNAYIGKELGYLRGIKDVETLGTFNAFPIHDDMFDQSVKNIVEAVKKALDLARPSDFGRDLSGPAPKSAVEARKQGCTALQCKMYV